MNLTKNHINESVNETHDLEYLRKILYANQETKENYELDKRELRIILSVFASIGLEKRNESKTSSISETAKYTGFRDSIIEKVILEHEKRCKSTSYSHKASKLAQQPKNHPKKHERRTSMPNIRNSLYPKSPLKSGSEEFMNPESFGKQRSRRCLVPSKKAKSFRESSKRQHSRCKSVSDVGASDGVDLKSCSELGKELQQLRSSSASTTPSKFRRESRPNIRGLRDSSQTQHSRRKSMSDVSATGVVDLKNCSELGKETRRSRSLPSKTLSKPRRESCLNFRSSYSSPSPTKANSDLREETKQYIMDLRRQGKPVIMSEVKKWVSVRAQARDL